MTDENTTEAQPEAPTPAKIKADETLTVPTAVQDAPRGVKAMVLCLLVTAIFVAADLASKQWAEGRLSAARTGAAPNVCENDSAGFVQYQRIPTSRIDLVANYFDFEYAENCGAAFGMGRSLSMPVRRVVFGIAALVACAALLWMFWAGRGGPWFAWSVPFVVSGAFGNFFDRMRFGYVVDFIHVHYKEAWNYPTFNVADITITIGMFMLIIDSFKQPSQPKTSQPKKSAK